MKIGLILERFDPQRGGLEHWTWQFARSLVARGHEVRVVAFDFHPDASSQGIIPHRLEMPRSRTERAELLAQRVPELGLEISHDMGLGWTADIIHPHGGSTRALWEHNLLRIPKWRQIRFWRERRYRELEAIENRQLHGSGALIVAVSQMVRGHFESLHGLAGDRIRVIYNGVDVERFHPRNRERHRAETRRSLGIRDEVLFLMLAHNLLLKNADGFLRALQILAKWGANVRAVIAGGRRPERFVKLAEKLRIADRVTFLDVVESVPYYAAADVFVHPTWYDPCSLVTMEAAACGLPVITTRYNGASEFLQDGGDSFVLHDPADLHTLAARMSDLLDPATRERMGRAGRILAQDHTFERQTDEFLTVYEEVLQQKAKH